jgi:hypothetical protein
VTALCADASQAAGEPLAGTAVTAGRWLLVEVPGSWPRDVASGEALPEAARAAVQRWLAARRDARLQYVRRPGRADNGSLVFVVTADETQAAVRRLELAGLDELASVDLDVDGDPVGSPLVLVCGHGSRDRCCALRGTAVFAALCERLDDEELWISSHLGGHRFAANVLVLPSGLQFGRVGGDEAPELVERAFAGRIALDRYRGRTCYESDAQAAEHAVRLESGLDRIGDLRLVRAEDGLAVFRAADGAEWSAVVERIAGPVVPASCGDEPASQRVLSARFVRGGSAGLSAGARTRCP